MTLLLEKLKDRIARGEDKPCIIRNMPKDPEAKLNEGKSSHHLQCSTWPFFFFFPLQAEVKSICLSMVAASLDTIPANLILGLAYLSSPHGQEIRDRAYAEIYKAYPNGDAWEKCLGGGGKFPYISAFCHGNMRGSGAYSPSAYRGRASGPSHGKTQLSPTERLSTW